MRKEKDSNIFKKITKDVSDFFYKITQPLRAKLNTRRNNNGTHRNAKRKKDLIFYTVLMAFPVLQFIVFYVIVNANSFLMAFKKYDNILGKYYFVGLDNIMDQISEFRAGGLLRMAATNSIKAYFLNLLLLPLEILFPFYIYKKLKFGGFFKVVLFLPHILSTMVLCLLYQYFVNSVIPNILLKWGIEISPLMYGNTAFMTAWAYGAFFGYTSVLMYHGSMVAIPKSMVEAARLDGCSLVQELWYITLPNIAPTIVTYLIAGISGIFSNQLNLYAFFNGDISHTATIGYVIFARSTGTGMAAYPVPAATGLICTVIITPIVLILRKVAKKYTNVA